jgi:hypothetical protein
VELILAYQNSRQMLLKFGQLPWEAFRENFARHYTLEPDFVLHEAYEGRSVSRYSVAPHVFEEYEALEADRDFHALVWNREPFERLFLLDAPLPRRFHTRYDPKNFANDALVILSTKRARRSWRNILEKRECSVTGRGFSVGEARRR